jgi:hypothetical protein
MSKRTIRLQSMRLAAVGAALLMAIRLGAQTPTAKPAELAAAKVSQPPSLDGRADDPAWKGATPVVVTAKGVMPRTLGTSTRVELRAAYTDTHIYILATWDDGTKDDAGHRTWRWDAEKKSYVEDADREDMFAIAFQHTGPFVPDMLAGVEATWDLWHWKAFRTNPQGYAMDKTHRYSDGQPSGNANKHVAGDGSDTWIARPQDAGDTVEVQHPAPTEFKGERVPRYSAGQPTGSAADVAAKGAWANGRWTVEFARRLDTGFPDDTAFKPGQAYSMGISVHDRTGEMDKASGAIVLTFRP